MSAIAYTTRRFAFAAGHRYWVDTWTAAENERVFGRLTVPHGHNYTVDVTVRGPIDERTGMVVDLAELKRVVGETVVERFEHADLNADPLLRGRVPTTENLALVIWDLLVAKVGTERLWQVRVWEDPTLFVDVRGEARSEEPSPAKAAIVRGEARSEEPSPAKAGIVRAEPPHAR